MKVKRTTWDDLFPRAVFDSEPIQGIVKGDADNACWLCQRPTVWVSLSWHAPICSYICDDLAWLGYGNEVWGVGWAERGNEPFR